MHGGKYDKRKQKAVVELICQRDTEKSIRSREVDDDDDDENDETKEKVDDGAGGSLQFISYGPGNEDEDILRLKWNTKYACEDAKDAPDGDGGKKRAHWGFFTWFIVV